MGLLALSSCVDEISIPPASQAEFLVVDGILNNTNNVDTQDLVIRLSYSRSTFIRPVALSKAKMNILVNEKDSYPLIEREEGSYYLTNPDILKVGASYKLQFQVAGNSYESSVEVLADSVPIQKTYTEVNITGTASKAFEVFVDMVDVPQRKNYYRWAITQWEAQNYCLYCYRRNRAPETCNEDLYALEGEVINRNLPCATNCYDIIRFTPNNAVADVFFDGKSLLKKSIGYVAYNFASPCLVEVKQSSLTPQYYAFLEILKTQAENTGGLADTPAALLVGNVKNLTNPQEKIVGYFSVTNNSVKRFWLDRSIAPPKLSPLSSLNPPLDPPIPTPPSWYPTPCKASRYRTPVKPWGWGG
jgi:Domain of unknown function (DUF4249)